MTEIVMDVCTLPLDLEQINTKDCLKYIQQFQNFSGSTQDIDHLLLHIKAIIDKELIECYNKSSIQYNQVVVNVAFRTYYQVLKKNNLEDRFFGNYIQHNDDHDDCNEPQVLKEKDFIILQSILLTSHNQDLNPEGLTKKCLRAFRQAVDTNDISLLSILKTLNLLCKKFPKVNVSFNLSLEHVYFCLQSNQLGMRDECVALMYHVCLNRNLALSYFQQLVNFWPWTNRNKLFLLGCILNKHSLDEFLHLTEHSRDDFFRGLRSTLNYKNLLAPSQYVVKALSCQKSLDMMDLSADILTLGSKTEIQNFYSQWFSRTTLKDELFEMIQQKPEIAAFIDNSADYLMDNEHSYRLILIFSMFSKQVFQLSKLHFFKLSTELLTNCFQYDDECQLLIFKFIVDNMANFSIEDCMEFVGTFLRTHSSVENSQFRNTMLGKMPNIINYVAKTFCNLCLNADLSSSLESSIISFFLQLQKDIENGLASEIYQPKIFCLKLLEILIKSLYVERVTKNSKNCCVLQNQQLGLFLKLHKVFDGAQMSMRLLELLNDPMGFDDALDLIASLINLLQPKENVVYLALDLSQKACYLSDVDECNLSFLYARVAVQNAQDTTIIVEFLQIILTELQRNMPNFDQDPLLACKSNKSHLFGLLNMLYEIIELKPELCEEEFLNILKLVEEIQQLVLKKLNKANILDEGAEIHSAASFEDMDKSLELLVLESKFESEDHEMSRKFLLMSFWLSLKACCDVASSMGKYKLTSKTILGDKYSFLERCLQVSVTVLTKCRHKGAIESAGLAIGKLTKCITSHQAENTPEFELLHQCLRQLYEFKDTSSTTRRGAGFSIMFLHIVRNEDHRSRPILRKAVENLLKNPNTKEKFDLDVNCDRLESLHLHYLCVLVRDTELREAMSKYYNEIMMAAVNQIDNPEWTICNAALQLFGALVPKIVGQKHATEFENPLPWESSEVTFSEIIRKLPRACDYILNYCLLEKSSTRSIILFLEFLHKVEYLCKTENAPNNHVLKFRELMFKLLKHPSQTVRKLAAKCFVRSHEFRIELPQILQQISTTIFSIKNENFFEGLIITLQEGILKLQHESKYITPIEIQEDILYDIKTNLEDNFTGEIEYTFFTLCKLWDLLQLLKHFKLLNSLKDLAKPQENMLLSVGYDLWLERIETY